MKFKITLRFADSLALILLSNYAIAQTTVPFVFQNNSPYADTALYVAVVGQDLAAGNHIWVDCKTGQQNPMSPSYNTVTGPVYSGNKGPGNNALYANCFTKLSDIPNKTIQLAGIQGCRIFISIHSQLYFYFFGTSGAPSGYTSPSYTDPTDPNTGITYEILELTNNQFGLWVNTSRVDAYNYSMGLELTDMSNVVIKTGELKNHADIGTAFLASVPTEFQGCYNASTGTIIFPTKTQGFSDGSIGTMPAIGPYVNYMKPYVDSIWNKYTTEDLIFDAGDAGIWKGRVSNDSLIMVAQTGGYVGQKGIVARRPTTQEAFEGKGILNNVVQNAATDLLVQAQICAALTRHMINTKTLNVGQQNWSDPTQYYLQSPCNYYAKFWHQQGVSYNQLSYGFAYDDVFNQSSTLHSATPKSTLVIFGGFADSTTASDSAPTTLPYGNTPATIPGKIEAENYDNGGQGIAYNDVDATNNGAQYRTDGVDIEASGEGGYDVGWTAAGEWMTYTVNVTTAGYYTLQARVASNTGGGLLHVGLNNTNISGSISVTNTGGWQFWQTISLTTTYLSAGLQTLTIYTDAAGYNIDYLNFIGPITTGLSVNITAPLNNITYTAGSTIPITVATSAINAVSKIQFYENNILLGQSTTSPYTFNWTNVAYGVYNITAKITDNTNATTTSAPITVTVNAVSSCPQPTWSDEFSGSTLDGTKWNYQTGNGCPGNCGWGNNELEYYTNTTNNISVGGGALVLTAQYQPNYNGSGNNYTSGKLLTAGDFSQKYGHFEARIKAPSTAGAWPAFWMLPNSGNWPSTGEIDILECLNANPTTWYGTLHFANSGGSHLSLGSVKTVPTPLSNDYHIYAAYWTTDSISWYIDDVLQGTVTKTALINDGGVWPFDSQNFYIILNFAVGGNFPGQTPDPTQFPVSMLVDYVRVYSSNTCSTCTYDTWTGAISNAWENPLNWSCGIVPGPTTDVIINAVGTNTVIVNSNVTIRSLQLNPAVHITMNTGAHFTINH